MSDATTRPDAEADTYHVGEPRPLLIGDMPAHDRPRERLWRLGPEGLKDEELLAIIIRIGPRGRSALDLARELLRTYGNSLPALAAAPPAELARIKGIGQAKAAELKATFALAARMAARSLHERAQLSSPEDAAGYLREVFRGKQQEEMHALLLDTRNRLVRDETITRGLLDRSTVHAREVFRPAIQHSASKLLLAHNHPSGDPSPSPQDLTCTKTLVEAGKTIGIEIVDHLVIGAMMPGQAVDYYSFREHGLM